MLSREDILRGRILVIAGSDPSGGAGIQADIKTITALNGYAMTAITALTAQNTTGVFGVEDVPVAFITDQLKAVVSDIGVDCVKIGMLHTEEIIIEVSKALAIYAPDIPIVLDPVMVAKGGTPLLKDSAVDALKKELIPMALLTTPNIPEGEVLSGIKYSDGEKSVRIAQSILKLGTKAVLLKGGHSEGPVVNDLLFGPGEFSRDFSSQKVQTNDTHGTGCTLASAIAVGISQGMSLEVAVDKARKYVLKGIIEAPGFGAGNGPLNHCHSINVK